MAGAQVEPYLYFNGRCEEALDFYKGALGAQVDMVMYYRDSPRPPAPGSIPPGFEGKVLHASFRIGSARLLASDGNREGAHFAGFSLLLALATEAEADTAFAALVEGGQVHMPLADTFWSPKFGVVLDRFGVSWKVTVAG